MATKVINALTFGDTYVLTTPYATCSTAAGTAAKVATITPGSAFSLETGVRVSVKFTNALSVAAPTLNVNSSGAKAIYFRGVTLSSAQYWAAGSTVDFVYDGNYWQMLGSQHNSTYSLSSFGITASATELNYTDGVTSNIQTQLNGKASSSHTHTTLQGIYTSNGGAQPPSYVGANALKCNMMNKFVGTDVTSFGSYADVLQMNAYSWSDVPYATAFAIQKTDGVPRAWIAAGGNTDEWSGATELITKNNIGSQSVNYANSAGAVAWGNVSSKPSYYDAKAIKGITRSGTTFTYTCMDGTTGTFSQQDNNTNTAHSHTAGTGLTVSGSGGTSGTTIYSANLNSTTSLGTIGTTSKLYAVGVDSAGKLCVNVPWTDTNTDTNTHYTTKLFATSSTGTAHAATTNGNTYLRLFDDSTARQSIKITGSGATTVTSDANGVITISSTDTNTNTDTKVTQNAVITTSGSYPVILGNSTATTEVTGTVNKSSKLLFNPSTGNLSIGTSGTDGSGSITLEGSLTMGSSQTDSQGIMPRASNWNSLGLYNKYWYRAYVSTVYCGSIKTLSGGTFSFPATITWNTF